MTAPSPEKPQTCAVHAERLVAWFLRGKGKRPTMVCLKCEDDRRRRLGWIK